MDEGEYGDVIIQIVVIHPDVGQNEAEIITDGTNCPSSDVNIERNEDNYQTEVDNEEYH